MTQRMLKCLTAGIAVSTQAAEAWSLLEPTGGRQFPAIPNGVALPSEPTAAIDKAQVLADHGLPNDGRPVWLAAGRLRTQKGFNYLIDAVAMVVKEYPGFCVGIAGFGPLAKDLNEQIARLGIDRNVRLLGRLNSLETLMRAVDGFVLSSITEAMPFVVLEAMSYGLPVVATEVGGVAELVRHRQNGILMSTR